jgi:bifunctional DNase/RNase
MEHEAEVEGIGVGVGDEGVGAPAVVLRAGGKLVPIFVSPDQAQSMQLALEDIPFDRPLTHDLLVEMITDFGGAIDRVRIDDLIQKGSNGTFYAKIDAELWDDEGERKKFVFDARPSDAISIALRVDCPIVVSDDVVEDAGRDPDEFEVDVDADEGDSGILGGGEP